MLAAAATSACLVKKSIRAKTVGVRSETIVQVVRGQRLETLLLLLLLLLHDVIGRVRIDLPVDVSVRRNGAIDDFLLRVDSALLSLQTLR